MIVLAIDTLVLVGLMKAFQDEDPGWLFPILLALGASVAAVLLSAGGIALLAPTLGFVGLLLGVLVGCGVTAAALGAILSAMYGFEIKRAMLIGGIFVAVHVVLSVAVEIAFSSA